MKYILYLIALPLLISCSKETPTEVVAVPSYMTNLTETQGWSSKYDFVKIHMDGYEFDRGYGAYENDYLGICESFVGNISPTPKSAEGAFVHLVAQVKGELYPNAPFKIGDEWTYNENTTLPITEVHMSGVNVGFILPQPFEESLLRGGYVVTERTSKTGCQLSINWTVVSEVPSGTDIEESFNLKMNSNQPKKIEILAIDRSTPGQVRITCAYNGIFAADSYLEEKLGRAYEIQAQGSFSYIIKL